MYKRKFWGKNRRTFLKVKSEQESAKEYINSSTGNDQTGKQTGKTNNFHMYSVA